LSALSALSAALLSRSACAVWFVAAEFVADFETPPLTWRSECAFAFGDQFLRLAVAPALRDFSSIVGVPEFGDFIRARRGETLAIAARCHAGDRSAVFHFAY